MLLSIHNLTVSYGGIPVVSDFSVQVDRGQIVMLVGESGSGKSTVVKSILGMLGQGATVKNGEIQFLGKQLPYQDPSQMRRILGKDIAVIFQDPDRYLDPMMDIGGHFHEIMSAHGKISAADARSLAVERLGQLGFKDSDAVLRKKPLELSGGMCQRASIAIAMANNPILLLGDEPTSALDVVLQEEVMEQIAMFRDTAGTAIFLVTHNMSIVARYADMVGVMEKGCLVEWGARDEILLDPQHFYTKMLLDAVPRIGHTFEPEILRHMQTSRILSSAEKKYRSETHWYLEGDRVSGKRIGITASNQTLSSQR